MLQEIFATNSREYWLKLLKESIIRKLKDIASNLGIRWLQRYRSLYGVRLLFTFFKMMLELSIGLGSANC
jgi:hypothetical protein